MIKYTRKEFDNWVKTVINKFETEEMSTVLMDRIRNYINNALKLNNFILNVFPTSNYVFILNHRLKELTIVRIKDKKIASAKCRKYECFTANELISICYARLNDWKIPQIVEYKSLPEMRADEEFKYFGRKYTYISNDSSDVKKHVVRDNYGKIKSIKDEDLRFKMF